MDITDFTYRLLINADIGTMHCEILDDQIKWWIKKAPTPDNITGIYLLEYEDPEMISLVTDSEYETIKDLEDSLIEITLEQTERPKPVTRSEGNVIYWLNP